MDFSKLRFGELVAAVGGIVLFVVMYLDWYAIELGGGVGEEIARGFARQAGVDTGLNAWQAYDVLDIFLLLVALVAVGLAVLTMTQRSVALPVAASVITAGLGLLATLGVLYRIVNQPGDNDLIGTQLGVWLGLASCLAIAIGGWQSMRSEGTSLQDVRQQAGRAAGGGEQPPPPAGPSA